MVFVSPLCILSDQSCTMLKESITHHERKCQAVETRWWWWTVHISHSSRINVNNCRIEWSKEGIQFLNSTVILIYYKIGLHLNTLKIIFIIGCMVLTMTHTWVKAAAGYRPNNFTKKEKRKPSNTHNMHTCWKPLKFLLFCLFARFIHKINK